MLLLLFLGVLVFWDRSHVAQAGPQTCYIAEDNFEFPILLSLPPKHRDYRYVPSFLAFSHLIVILDSVAQEVSQAKAGEAELCFLMSGASAADSWVARGWKHMEASPAMRPAPELGSERPCSMETVDKCPAQGSVQNKSSKKSGTVTPPQKWHSGPATTSADSHKSPWLAQKLEKN